MGLRSRGVPHEVDAARDRSERDAPPVTVHVSGRETAGGEAQGGEVPRRRPRVLQPAAAHVVLKDGRLPVATVAPRVKAQALVFPHESRDRHDELRDEVARDHHEVGPPVVVEVDDVGPHCTYGRDAGSMPEDSRRRRGRLMTTESSGIEPASLPYVQWGTDIVDLDDDGRPDLVMVSGHLVPKLIMSIARFIGKNKSLGLYARGDRSYRQPPVLYHNVGGGRLEDATATSGDLAALRLAARGLAAGDVDGDGRLDVALAAVAGGIHLMRNSTASQTHALEYLPVAGADRRTVLGTKVVVTAAASGRCRSSSSGPHTPQGRGCRCTSASGRRLRRWWRSSRLEGPSLPRASRASPLTASTPFATGSSRRRGHSAEGNKVKKESRPLRGTHLALTGPEGSRPPPRGRPSRHGGVPKGRGRTQCRAHRASVHAAEPRQTPRG